MTELAEILQHFVDGGDTTLVAANRLEVLLDETYPKDEVVQLCVSDLACYRPGGGDFLFDQAAMQERLKRVGKHLNIIG